MEEYLGKIIIIMRNQENKELRKIHSEFRDENLFSILFLIQKSRKLREHIF